MKLLIPASAAGKLAPAADAAGVLLSSVPGASGDWYIIMTQPDGFNIDWNRVEHVLYTVPAGSWVLLVPEYPERIETIRARVYARMNRAEKQADSAEGAPPSVWNSIGMTTRNTLFLSGADAPHGLTFQLHHVQLVKS